MEKDRQVVKAATTKSAAKKIKDFAQAKGLKEYFIIGKLMDWFVEQDDLVQRAILGQLEGVEVSAARRFMERFGADAATPEARHGVPRDTGTDAPKASHPDGGGIEDVVMTKGGKRVRK